MIELGEISNFYKEFVSIIPCILIMCCKSTKIGDILAKEKNNSTEKKYLDNSNENINDKVLIYFWDIIFFKESNPEILIFKITSLLSFLKQFLDLSKNSIYRWMTLSNTILFYIVFSV